LIWSPKAVDVLETSINLNAAFAAGFLEIPVEPGFIIIEDRAIGSA
jgi:hypothetical protein